LYGGQEITHQDILAAFNKEFPFIKVVTVTGRGGDLMARIIAERRADKYLTDLMASGPNGPRMLYLGKALDPITPAFILPEVTDPSQSYAGEHRYAVPGQCVRLTFRGSRHHALPTPAPRHQLVSDRQIPVVFALQGHRQGKPAGPACR